MTPPTSAIRSSGRGPDVVFIHGAAADRSSWSVPAALLRDRIRATVYDRRGTSSWPVPDTVRQPLVEDHVEDACDVIRALGRHPVHVCGASFGAVIALELIRRRPDLVHGAVLFEPALSGDGSSGAMVHEMTHDFERCIDLGRPERAAERFHRRLLGDAAWNALPSVMRREAARKWRPIRYDLIASAAHRVRYEELGSVKVPVLLLCGGRSRTVFEPALSALRATLPQSRCRLIPRAEHLLRGGAWHEFAAALTEFIDHH